MAITRQMLEQYRAIKREISRINNKLEYYKTHPLASTHGVVQSSMKEYPYAQTHTVVSGSNIVSDRERNAKVSQLIVELTARKEELENVKLDIDCAIEEITDMEMRQIVQYKYIDDMTDEKIARIFGYERSTITKKLATFTQFTF